MLNLTLNISELRMLFVKITIVTVEKFVNDMETHPIQIDFGIQSCIHLFILCMS